MRAADLYHELVAHGIVVMTDGEHLEVEGPDVVVTEGLVERIRQHQAALIAHLRLFVEVEEVTDEIEGVRLRVDEFRAILALRRWVRDGVIATLPPKIKEYGFYDGRDECERRARMYLGEALRDDHVGGNARWWITVVVEALRPVCDSEPLILESA